MNIVTVSPYKIANYGAILQAWALRTALESMGHDVRHLDCDWMWHGYSNSIRLIRSRSIGSFCAKLRANVMMRRSFTEVGPIPETKRYFNCAELMKDPPVADCYIAGSDQIFGENYLGDQNWYVPVTLGFGHPDVKRISYAASFGTDKVETCLKYLPAAKGLERFSAIGIREKSGLSILKAWSNREGCWTPDPVFLHSADDYRRQFKIAMNGGRSCCTYLLGWKGRELTSKNACRAAIKQLGLNSEVKSLKAPLSVGGWLNEIANCGCLVTNSFHGLCFALIFNRPFILLGFDGADAWRNERHIDLLSACGCGCGPVCTAEDALESSPLNLNFAKHHQSFAEKGFVFLKEAL